MACFRRCSFPNRRGKVLALVGACFVLAGSVGRAQEPPTPRLSVEPQQGTYRSRLLGIDYQLVPYAGHLGAKLVAPPAAGSPLLQVAQPGGGVVYLEPDDILTSLDSRLIDGPDELDAHYGATTIEFVNRRTGQVESGRITLPALDGQGPVAGESARVRALLVIDTNSRLNGLEADEDRATSLMDMVGRERVDLTVLKGDRATPAEVVRQIRAWGNARSDTAFVYYSGHGATDPQRGHALTFTQGGPLFRSQLRAELARLQPRLTVILTDCCSNVVNLNPTPGAPAPMPSDVVESLFLRTRGVVDINGSTFDRRAGIEESAWCLPEGGFFTESCYLTILQSSSDELDRNRDGLVQWSEALPVVAERLHDRYTAFRNDLLSNPRGASPRTLESLRRQPNQTPQAFSLDGNWIPTGFTDRHTLGVKVDLVRMLDAAGWTTGMGARIVEVTPGGAAARGGLEPNDIITRVDGSPFASLEEFLQRVAETPERCILDVRNVRGGQMVRCTIQFESPTPPAP